VAEFVGRIPQYEAFADEFLDHAEDGFSNAHYDRPACLALLGDVQGKQVLDAACGPGLYAAVLVGRGARVTGFDASARMVKIAVGRVPSGQFRVHDLGDPLDWLPDASVDAVLFALAVEYIDARVISEVWSRGWQVRYWLNPLEQTCEELYDAGFLIERLWEPRPLPSGASLEPEEYARLHREPRGFLAIRVVPRP
jgi:SAM-dependent methyltransferase